MKLSERWGRFARSLDALAGAIEFDPHEAHRARLTAVEDRLELIERQLQSDTVGHADRVDATR